MSGGGTGDTQFWWVDAAGAERGAGGCRVFIRTLAPGLSRGSCGSLAASAARAKQVGDFVFPCQPLTQPRAPAGERRRAPGGLRGSDPAAPVPPAGAHHSLGSRLTSGWARVPHAFPEASSRGLPVDRWAAHSFPGWYAEDPGVSQDRVSGRGAPESRGARSSVRAFVSPRTHLGVGFVQMCSHLRESPCSGGDT